MSLNWASASRALSSKAFLADAALVVRFQADEDFAFRHFAAAASGGEDVRHFVVLAQGLFDFAHVGVGLLQGAGRRQLHVDLAHADVAFGHEAGGQQREQHHRAGKQRRTEQAGCFAVAQGFFQYTQIRGFQTALRLLGAVFGTVRLQ